MTVPFRSSGIRDRLRAAIQQHYYRSTSIHQGQLKERISWTNASYSDLHRYRDVLGEADPVSRRLFEDIHNRPATGATVEQFTGDSTFKRTNHS
jgi:hypothetical protein